MSVDGRPPPLRLRPIALASDLEPFALGERQLVGVFRFVVARGVDHALVGHAQLAHSF